MHVPMQSADYRHPQPHCYGQSQQLNRLTRITTGQSTVAPYVNRAPTAIQMAGTMIINPWTASSMRYIITLTKPIFINFKLPAYLTQLGLKPHQPASLSA